ncbi:hypothetical protein Hanom_Chr16g01437461 [Helianthus anomalus]
MRGFQRVSTHDNNKDVADVFDSIDFGGDGLRLSNKDDFDVKAYSSQIKAPGKFW